MVRLNITLPESLVDRIKDVRNKSRFIAEALEEKINRDERARLKCLMIEGYQETAKEDQLENKEWEKGTLQEGWG